MISVHFYDLNKNQGNILHDEKSKRYGTQQFTKI